MRHTTPRKTGMTANEIFCYLNNGHRKLYHVVPTGEKPGPKSGPRRQCDQEKIGGRMGQQSNHGNGKVAE